MQRESRSKQTHLSYCLRPGEKRDARVNLLGGGGGGGVVGGGGVTVALKHLATVEPVPVFSMGV